MAAAATSASSSQVTEIERLGFKWNEVAQFDLARLDRENRAVQVRAANNYAHRDEVTAYAQQMGQVAFPPIVVTKDDYLVDGNTRVAAAVSRKDRFFPAIIIGEAYATAEPSRQLEFKALAATLNNQNGRRQTPREMRQTVAELVSLGWRIDQVQRVTGAKPADVRQIKWEIDARDRLKTVGLSNGQVRATGASLRTLGKPVVLGLNHEPYREVARLAMDAGLNAAEIVEVATSAKATGSDQAALEQISKVRQENAERIRRHQFEAGTTKPPVARQLRQHLGFVAAFDGKESALIETNHPSMAQHIDVLDKAMRILTDVATLQRAKLTEIEEELAASGTSN